MILTIWPDGTLIKGESWRELEEEVRLRQWHKMSIGQFRREMQRRAHVWSGKSITTASAESLFRAMESVGMVRIDLDAELVPDPD